ncbi:hypothetical protein E2C01_086832 [Portunus trituberculatus]|uniref:Uncharacterized protein n=1 Tax=Portunus trituberculatus TaxID=210409 RepID=A0A5B7JHF2_PORTR|nr:hypothetical protein [Portunus trituberculatus]
MFLEVSNYLYVPPPPPPPPPPLPPPPPPPPLPPPPPPLSSSYSYSSHPIFSFNPSSRPLPPTLRLLLLHLLRKRSGYRTEKDLQCLSKFRVYV